jgi:hypothetical protein
MRPGPSCATLAVVLFTAAAGLAQAAEPAAKPAAASAAASAVPAAPKDKGQVVFFRKASMFGFPYWTNIRENDVALGKLTNGVYFIQTLDPGVHTFNTSVLGKDAMKLQIDPGETYYVEGKITMAVVGYTIVMAPSDDAAFQKAFKGMKPAPPVDPAKPDAAAK